MLVPRLDEQGLDFVVCLDMTRKPQGDPRPSMDTSRGLYNRKRTVLLCYLLVNSLFSLWFLQECLFS